MSTLKSGFTLAEGEKLVMEIEADVWIVSSNLFARIAGFFQKLIALLLGVKRKRFLIITDRRVIEINSDIICWCITVGKTVSFIMPRSLVEVGYTRVATCVCCCFDFHLYYRQLIGLPKSLLLKKADEAEAVRVVEAFYHAVNTPS